MSKFVSAKEFIEATISVHPHQTDAVTSYITDNLSDGVEIAESNNGQLVSIKFYVPATKIDFRPALKEYLSQIAHKTNSETPHYEERTIKSEDWEESYKRSFAPEFVGEDIVVRPPWAEAPDSIKFDIIIEPKMAFGTGHHETTRACLKLIHQYFKPGQRLLDFGCGSGVLTILASMMGAAFIKAVDYDPIATDNTLENFKINNVSCQYAIEMGSFEKTANDSPYDMVCANLQRKDLVANFKELVNLTAADGYLLLSGLLETDQSEIEHSITNAKLKIVEFIHEGEWLTYLLKR